MSDARRMQDRLTKAARLRDVDAIVACYAPDAVVTTPEGTFRGREELGEYLRGQFEAFPDFDVAVHTKVDAGDVAVDEGTVTGTHSGLLPLPNGEVVEPTGKRVTQRVADVLVVRDGLVAEHRLYYDQVEILVQLDVEALTLQPA
jgi:ketosteroid isomerase-like protein